MKLTQMRHAKKVILMGKHEPVVQAMKLLLNSPFVKVVRVVTSSLGPSQTAGWFPILASQVESQAIPLIAPADVNVPSIIETIRNDNPDIVISVNYDQILRSELIRIPQLGCVNLHLSLLPKCRGCFPVPWSMIEGELTGVTLHYIDESIDTGDIILQQKLRIDAADTALTLYNRLVEAGMKVLKTGLYHVVTNQVTRIKQDDSHATYHGKMLPNDRWIDWLLPATTILRFVRALTFASLPAARTSFGDRVFEVLAPVVKTGERHHNPGQITDIDEDGLSVASGSGEVLKLKCFRQEQKICTWDEFGESLNLRPGDELFSPREYIKSIPYNCRVTTRTAF